MERKKIKKYVQKDKLAKPVNLSELDKIFNTLDQYDQFVTSSKQFFSLIDDSCYKCDLCNIVIERSKSVVDLRYNIWVHLNTNTHQTKLPNYEKLNTLCTKIVQELSLKVPEDSKEDLKCLKIGPVYGFLICTICQSAVSWNQHRLKNHLVDKHHIKNKRITNNESKIKSDEKITNVPSSSTEQSNVLELQERRFHLVDKHHIKNKRITNNKSKITSDEKIKNVPSASTEQSNVLDLDLELQERRFHTLLSKLPEDIKTECKYIERGCVPGFITCTLCSRTVIQTPFYLERHLNDFWHKENKNNPLCLAQYRYSRRDPFAVKLTTNYYMSPFGMYIFLSMIKCGDSDLKEHSKFLFKQHTKDLYSCQLCGVTFEEKIVSILFNNILTHFRDKEHSHNASCYDPSSVKNQSDNSKFCLFGNVPEEIYEDVGYLKLSMIERRLGCSLCECELSLNLTVLIDHVQSKQHRRRKINANLASNTEDSSAIDIIFHELSKQDKTVMNGKKFFHKMENDGTVMCGLCNLVVGSSSDSVVNLEKKILLHLPKKSHKRNLSVHVEKIRNLKRNQEHLLKEMFDSVPALDEINRSCIVLSKKRGQLKCKACKSRFVAVLVSLQGHINEKEHKNTVKRKILNQPNKEKLS